MARVLRVAVTPDTVRMVIGLQLVIFDASTILCKRLTCWVLMRVVLLS